MSNPGPDRTRARELAAEFSAFAHAWLTEISFEDFLDQETPPVRRFRALYQRS